MFDNEDIELKNRAGKILADYKKAEKKIKFHSAKIGKNTVVFCKNKENIEKYKNQYKTSKITFLD